MRLKRSFLSLLFLTLGIGGCATVSPTASVRLNQMQVIGSHNSYHLRAYDSLRTMLATKSPLMAIGLDYTHVLLTEQINRLGIRQIELDCFADPDGGLLGGIRPRPSCPGQSRQRNKSSAEYGFGGCFQAVGNWAWVLSNTVE